jgi:hypothetical protein
MSFYLPYLISFILFKAKNPDQANSVKTKGKR